ncbi:voltage-gated hydrogen channel 1-like [Convolutriloba macropyga]|uniref:voltage-gated hydrogen channel 1-like n=1 Tax=Convolutriloba macropyga TaxID=536237 RepID=UPI003F527D59
MSGGFRRLNDDHEILVNENSAFPQQQPITRQPQGGGSFHDKWRPILRNVFSHLHFDIGIIMFVLLYTSLIMLEMIINLDMLKVHHSSPVPRWLHLMGVSILAYFVVEVILRIYAFGYEILYEKFELFDITVVVTTFIFEMVFIQHEDALSTTGLIVLMRMWRVGNVINGLVKNVQNEKSCQVRTLQKEIESYRNTNLRLSEKNEKLEQKIRFYQSEMEKRGIAIEYEEAIGDIQAEQNEPRPQRESNPGSSSAATGRQTFVVETHSRLQLGDGHLSFRTTDE